MEGTTLKVSCYLVGTGYYDYVIRAINGLIDDSGEYMENPIIPKKAFCDFTAKHELY